MKVIAALATMLMFMLSAQAKPGSSAQQNANAHKSNYHRRASQAQQQHHHQNLNSKAAQKHHAHTPKPQVHHSEKPKKYDLPEDTKTRREERFERF